jgi:LysR family transcriptional regulator, glycine cleavage system transcriptional activator
MGKRMPPFKSIEAFVVAARALSFTEAASALHLTVPAVSRRIQNLETELGVPLFHRKHRGLQLTDAGASYLSRLAPAIETIRHASDRIRGQSHGHSLKVSLPASLAANWLVPRLRGFHAEHGGIQIELQSMNGCADLDASEADLAIWPGTGDWPGLRAQRLLDMDAYPVCGADFLSAGQTLRSPDDLLECPLLGIAGQEDSWPEWLRAAGVAGPARVQQVFDNFHLLYRAATSGLGVALGVDAIVGPYLEASQLVRPFDVSFRLTKGYYVVCRSGDWTQQPIGTFREWLMTQAGAGKNACN